MFHLSIHAQCISYCVLHRTQVYYQSWPPSTLLIKQLKERKRLHSVWRVWPLQNNLSAPTIRWADMYHIWEWGYSIVHRIKTYDIIAVSGITNLQIAKTKLILRNKDMKRYAYISTYLFWRNQIIQSYHHWIPSTNLSKCMNTSEMVLFDS